jgi:hypothetical protein
MFSRLRELRCVCVCVGGGLLHRNVPCAYNAIYSIVWKRMLAINQIVTIPNTNS